MAAALAVILYYARGTKFSGTMVLNVILDCFHNSLHTFYKVCFKLIIYTPERMTILKKILYFMFGKPYTESKVYHSAYWLGVGFYFLAMILSIVSSVLYGGWISLLFIGVIFPVFFRIVYKTNTLIHTSFKGMNKKVIIILGIIFGVFTIGMITASFFFADNKAINTSKTTINGDVRLSIGSLKGSHNVESFEIAENGTVSVPYKASVGDGEFLMYVKDSEKTVWKDEITSFKNGVIEFQAEKGTYDINIYTEEAKKIKLNISL